MKLRNIIILESDANKKGDLFGRLMGDLFHSLGYDKPRLNIHKSGREIDLQAFHRIENKIAIAECKAHSEKIGGDDINKFYGAYDAERKSINKSKKTKGFETVGYFISLSGFTETAIEQENELDNHRLIMVDHERVIKELINGKIVVPIEKAISSISSFINNLTLCDYADLLAYERGWIWVIYLSDSDGQKESDFSLVHAEGKPLIKELAEEIIKNEKKQIYF